MVSDFITAHPDATQLIAVAAGMWFFWLTVLHIEAHSTPRSARRRDEDSL